MNKFNKKILVILFLLILLILLIFYSINKISKKEFFENRIIDLEIVVSRYNEDLEWLKEEPFNKYSVKCYNKGPNENFYKPDNMEIIKLDNLGRDYGTYIYHIINNYDNIKTHTMFLPGSTQLPHRIDKAKKWIKEIEKNNTNVDLNNYCPIQENGILEDLKDFKLDEYSASDPKNLSINNNSYLMPNDRRPFGEWYKHHFNNKLIKNICWNGVFGIHKDNILQNPKSYYEVFLEELNRHSNTEVIHYFERGFVALFYPLNY